MPTLANKTLAPPFTKDEILAYLKELKAELEKDGIVELGLFGSYANGCADEFSDIDIVFSANDEFHKKFSGFNYFTFLAEIRKKIKRRFRKKIDLIDAKYIKKDKTIFFKGAIYV